MRNARILCLVVAAANLAMALAGPSGASAFTTELCKQNESPCSPSQIYPSGTVFHAATEPGKPVRFEWPSHFTTFECASSEMSGEYTEPTGSPALAKITRLTFTSCASSHGGNCAIEASNLPYQGAFAAGPTLPNGTLRITKGSTEAQNPEISIVQCGELSCEFRAEEGIYSEVTAGSPADINVPKVALHKLPENSCGTIYMNGANYRQFIAETPHELTPTLCARSEANCLHPYSVGTKLSAALSSGTESVLSSKLINSSIKCKKATLSGQITENPAGSASGKIKGEINSAGWNECTWYEGEVAKGSCEVRTLETPWTLHIERGETAGNGNMWIGPHEGGTQPRMEIANCGTFTGCIWRAREQEESGGPENWLKLALTGGTSASAAVNAKLASPNLCGGATLSASYNMSPAEMWVELSGSSPFYLV